jgi:hypothetical protein
LPVHYKAEEYLDAYLKAAGIGDQKGTPLWRSMTKEHAQAIAAHESPRTTKLYDRTTDEITLDEIERIGI